MGKIENIEKNLPHYAEEVMCIKCLKRYMCVWPVGVALKKLECENCGSGYIIRTNCDEHKDYEEE